MQPTARSLILDLLGTLGPRSAPVRALVCAGRTLGVAENGVRVALARLVAEGLAESDARGRYRLGPSAASVADSIRSWRRLEEAHRPWSGAWVGAHLAGLARASAPVRRRRARALRFLGFRPLTPGLEVRPDNLAGGVGAVRARLRGLGLDPEALVYSLDGLDAGDDRRARGSWDVRALVAGYRATRARLEASAARLEDLPREEAMAESFLIGGDAIRQLVLDPLLPEPILDARERRALVDAMRSYDRLGRRMWSGWLLGEATEPETCPAGVQGLAAAGSVLRSAGGA